MFFDLVFDRKSALLILGIGHSVRYDSGFKGYNGKMVFEGLLDVRSNRKNSLANVFHSMFGLECLLLLK